jgi:hypothetical protein
MLDNLFKLEKLKIIAYKNVGRTQEFGTFEAMFNPESFSRHLGIKYNDRDQSINSSGKQQLYARSEPEQFTIKLILDGTGVNEKIGLTKLFGKTETVSDRIEKLLDLTFKMNGDIHEPNYIKIVWGDLNLACRLKNMNINYTNFDRSGHPLRAEIDLSLISDEDPTRRLRKENKNSPDLTHSRIVMVGDTLPLLTKQIYGSSVHYLKVAQFNQLDDFRNLTPGQRLYFPPLTQDTPVH